MKNVFEQFDEVYSRWSMLDKVGKEMQLARMWQQLCATYNHIIQIWQCRGYLTADEYKALSEKEKEKYYDNPYGYATYLPEVSTTAWESSSNMSMFLIIGAIVVVVLIVAVFLYTKNKKAQA